MGRARPATPEERERCRRDVDRIVATILAAGIPVEFVEVEVVDEATPPRQTVAPLRQLGLFEGDPA